jgi:hypothetical protein
MSEAYNLTPENHKILGSSSSYIIPVSKKVLGSKIQTKGKNGKILIKPPQQAYVLARRETKILTLPSVTAQNINQLQSASYMDFKVDASDSVIHQLYIRFDIGNSSTASSDTITVSINPLWWLSSVEILNTSGDRIQEVYAEALFANLMFVDNDKLDLLMSAGIYSSSTSFGSNTYNTIAASTASQTYTIPLLGLVLGDTSDGEGFPMYLLQKGSSLTVRLNFTASGILASSASGTLSLNSVSMYSDNTILDPHTASDLRDEFKNKVYSCNYVNYQVITKQQSEITAGQQYNISLQGIQGYCGLIVLMYRQNLTNSNNGYSTFFEALPPNASSTIQLLDGSGQNVLGNSPIPVEFINLDWARKLNSSMLQNVNFYPILLCESPKLFIAGSLSTGALYLNGNFQSLTYNAGSNITTTTAFQTMVFYMLYNYKIENGHLTYRQCTPYNLNE